MTATQSNRSLRALEDRAEFTGRHIGPRDDEIDRMLSTIGLDSLGALISEATPPSIRSERPLNLAAARNEAQVLNRLRAMADANTVNHSMIGLGYHPTHVPPVILRNVLENPGWYTAYTPYQAEISQGRLEGLLNFQQDGNGQCVAARRGHRRGRSHDHDPSSHTQEQVEAVPD
jgi:glycine dehydrogenase